MNLIDEYDSLIRKLENLPKWAWVDSSEHSVHFEILNTLYANHFLKQVTDSRKTPQTKSNALIQAIETNIDKFDLFRHQNFLKLWICRARQKESSKESAELVKEICSEVLGRLRSLALEDSLPSASIPDPGLATFKAPNGCSAESLRKDLLCDFQLRCFSHVLSLSPNQEEVGLIAEYLVAHVLSSLEGATTPESFLRECSFVETRFLAVLTDHEELLSDWLETKSVDSLTQLGACLKDISESPWFRAFGMNEVANRKQNFLLSLGAVLHVCAGQSDWLEQHPFLAEVVPRIRNYWFNPSGMDIMDEWLNSKVASNSSFLADKITQRDPLSLEKLRVDLLSVFPPRYGNDDGWLDLTDGVPCIPISEVMNRLLPSASRISKAHVILNRQAIIDVLKKFQATFEFSENQKSVRRTQLTPPHMESHQDKSGDTVDQIDELLVEALSKFPNLQTLAQTHLKKLGPSEYLLVDRELSLYVLHGQLIVGGMDGKSLDFPIDSFFHSVGQVILSSASPANAVNKVEAPRIETSQRVDTSAVQHLGSIAQNSLNTARVSLKFGTDRQRAQTSEPKQEGFFDKPSGSAGSEDTKGFFGSSATPEMKSLPWNNSALLRKLISAGLEADDDWDDLWQAFCNINCISVNQRRPENLLDQLIIEFLQQNDPTGKPWAQSILQDGDAGGNDDRDKKKKKKDKKKKKKRKTTETDSSDDDMDGRLSNDELEPLSDGEAKDLLDYFNLNIVRTALCPHARLGHCWKGQDCPMAHCEEDLESFVFVAPDESQLPTQYYRTRICYPFLEGRCAKGATCGYAHIEEDLKEPGEARAEMEVKINRLRAWVKKQERMRQKRIRKRKKDSRFSVDDMFGFGQLSDQEINQLLKSPVFLDLLKHFNLNLDTELTEVITSLLKNKVSFKHSVSGEMVDLNSVVKERKFSNMLETILDPEKVIAVANMETPPSN